VAAMRNPAATPLTAPEQYPAILTPTETAALLRLPLGTVYSLIHRGVLPARRFGRQYRLRRDEVLALLVTTPGPVESSEVR